MRIFSTIAITGLFITLLNPISSVNAGTIVEIEQPAQKFTPIKTSVTTTAPNNDDFLYGNVANQVTGKPIKIESLRSLDIEIKVNKSGGTTEYRFQQELVNATGKNLAGYRYELGFGTKDKFVNSNLKDKLDFDSPTVQQQEVSGELRNIIGAAPISFNRGSKPTTFKRNTISHTSNSLLSSGNTIRAYEQTNIYFFLDVPDGLPNRPFTLRITPLPIASNEIKDDSQLPIALASAVLKDMSRRTSLSTQELRIVEVKPMMIPISCGMPRPGFNCLQSFSAGWEVVVTGKQYRWVYHVTSDRGTIELIGRASISPSLIKAALQQTSQRANLPGSELTIFWVEPKIWSDGCLNLASPGTLCTQSMVPGWQITVASGNRRWVYNTDLYTYVKFNTQTVEEIVQIAPPVWSEKPATVKK